jgi:putative spermidine/putrescine transport system ATP-binding protein
MAYIEFQGIHKYFGENHVLKGIDLSIEEGELVTLLGPSGCGKSTLLRCFSGLEQVSEGKILLNGVDITYDTPNQRKIGMVFQQYSLFPNMTAAENVAFGLKMQHKDKATIAKKVQETLALVGLEDKANQYPRELSGGQQQRVALARAIVMEPRVLLLDEPLSAIDALLRRNLQVEIRRIQQELKITTIFVTHDQDEAMVMSDEIHLLNAGQIEQSGKPEELYAAPKTSFVANFMGHYNLMPSADFSRFSGKNFSCKNIAIRPEAISIVSHHEESADKIEMSAKIVSAITRGNTLSYTIENNGVRMHTDTLFNPHFRHEIGEDVILKVACADILQLV